VAELWQPIARRPDRVWIHVVLFLLTLVTTTVAGVDHYLAFLGDFSARGLSVSQFAHGHTYFLTIMPILSAHDMGHYVA
jgi:hypothetical protein